MQEAAEHLKAVPPSREEPAAPDDLDFRIFARALPIMGWSGTAEVELDWFNDATIAYCGMRHDQLACNGWKDTIHPEDADRVLMVWQEAIVLKARCEFECRIRGADGAYLWHLVRAVPLFDSSGRMTRWIGSNTNVDDLRSAREAVEMLNASLEHRVATRTRERDRSWRLSQDLLVVAEHGGFMRAVNEAWTRLLGWPMDELVDTRFILLTHPDDVKPTQAAFASVFDTPLDVPHECRLRHRDGTYRWFAWTGAFEDGLVYCSGRHTTAEHEAADALRATEDQLRHSQKMEAVGQLTGGLAHDFNNLLTGITGSLDLLQRRVAQGRLADVDRHIGVAQAASQRAAALTHRLLAFSRRQALVTKPVGINRLVSDLEDLLRRTVGPEIEITIVAAGDLWVTRTDPNQVENALLNLCINARDAMPNGGHITIETANTCIAHTGVDETRIDDEGGGARDIAPGEYVTIRVTDTGTGMPPDVVACAFDPFFTTKPIGQGTGLGLAMIDGFARQSDGRVWIRSEVGRGSTISIDLPRYHGADTEPQPPRGLSQAPRAEGGETVLVVDDESMVRTLVAEALAELGYSAIEAADGVSGLKVVQTDARIDLLVSDLGLRGGMSGRQMVEAARAQRPGLKVLFITGFGDAALAQDDIDPSTRILGKPFAMETLATSIKSLIAS